MALQLRDHAGRPAPLKSTLNLPLSFRSSYKQEEEEQQQQEEHNNSNWKSSSRLLRTAKGKLPLVPHHPEDEDEDQEEEEEEQSETSSIGDCSSADEDEEEEEEQEELSNPNTSNNQQHEYSPFSLANNAHDDQSCSKKSSLSSLDSLEDSLPFKRGLSNFYSGKSKSFTSLSTAANATAKDIVKPENPLNKRRRLFIARSRNRRASCTSLVSIAEAECPYPFLPLLPSVLSECDDEEEDDDDDDDEEAEESVEQASPSSHSSEQHPRSMMRRSRTEKRRPSLFTVSVTPFEARPDHDSFLTPKSVRSGSGNTKLALKSPGRSYSLSDLTRHPQLAHPMPGFND